MKLCRSIEDKSSNFHITDVTFAMNHADCGCADQQYRHGCRTEVLLPSTDTTEDTDDNYRKRQTTESADTQSTESS